MLWVSTEFATCTKKKMGDPTLKRETDQLSKAISEALTSSLIQFSVIAFIVLACTWAFAPFLPIMLWALVLAIALQPVYLALKAKMGGSSGRPATVLVLVGLLLIGVPTVLMGSAFATQLIVLAEGLSEGTIKVPAPSQDVAELPLIGENLHESWAAAATDLPAFLEKMAPQLKSFGGWIAGVAAGTAGGVFKLLGALIVAGIMLAWSEEGSRAMGRIFSRFAGPERGLGLQDLTTKTVRSVAVGIIGIAFVTAFLLGIIFFLSGIPGAGILAVLALLFGIMQIPITLIALVGVALLWSTGGDNSTVFNVIFTVLMIVGSMVDNILKPIVLGRGLDVPMPVILIGALGGMMSGGFLGMFIGASFLAAGYQLFMGWVDAGSAENASPDVQPR